MDFDLFEMEDDDMFSSMCMTQTELIDLPANSLPEFNCQGEDLSLDFSSDTFAGNFSIFITNFENSTDIYLTSYKFLELSLYSNSKANIIFGQARMHIQKLIASIKYSLENDGCTFYESRQQVTSLFHMINGSSTLNYERLESYLENITNLLDKVATKAFFKSIYLANSCKGNETDSATYHLLHGFLEWRILELGIIKKQFNEKLKVGREGENIFLLFLQRYTCFMENLLQISICLFQKKSLPDQMFQSSFPCICVKESWLLLQYMVETLKTQDISFWKIFNDTIEKLRNDMDKFDISTDKFPQFLVWLLKGLVKLQGYKINGIYDGSSSIRIIDNFVLLEPTVEQFLSLNPSEENIRIFLCNLMPILLEWWSAKPNISMILWEYFHKKLNSQFFIAGSAPCNLAISSSTGKKYLENIKQLLVNCVPDANRSSYSTFTIILGKTIQKLNKSNQTNQVQKIFGRIYSKFSIAKFLALTETGIHHLIELFLILTLSCDIVEIAPKLKDKLLTIELNKISLNRQKCVTKGHIAMMILYRDNLMDLSEYINKLLKQITDIKNDINICKILAEGLCEILDKSENLENGEYLLIDSWIPHYLNNSLLVEQERILEVINSIFKQTQHHSQLHLLSSSIHALPPSSSNALLRTNNFQNLIKNLNLHIFPYIKQNFTTSFSIWIPKLAAEFCIHYHYNSFIAETPSTSATNCLNANDQGIFQKNFQFFTEAQCLNKQATLQFILVLLASEKVNLVQPSTIIQIWLRSLVLLSSNNEDVLNLTKTVTKLEEFRSICDLNEKDLLTSKEPLCIFISSIGRNYRDNQNFQNKCSTSDKFNKYLNGFEKWISDKNEKPEIIMRFYSFIAIIIFNCAEIVYARAKITCFFHIAMTRFIMPTTIQMGKEPDQKLTQVIHKIWPVLVQGIGTLNFKNDPYILKTLSDLIIKWTPHFKLSSNPKVVARPFLNCLSAENHQLSIFVFEKLTNVFLTMQRRQADPNACLIITIFKEVVETNKSDVDKLYLFLKATCLTTLEHLMMVEDVVPSRALLLELFKIICKCEAFQNNAALRELITEHIRIITIKHLSFYTFFYFNLLTQIVNICVELVEPILEFLNEQIKIVEQKRGGGEDKRIRNCYQKLKNSIISVKNKKELHILNL